MQKILRQNIDNVDYSMAGCALYGTCVAAASDFVKVVTLTDGDEISDGMSLAVAFTNGNTAGNAPKTTTIYSSDQVHYYTDSGLTQPFTLAPSGCYTITYTGTGNAYTYESFPALSVGGVTAPVCSMNGRYIGNNAWNAGDIGFFVFTANRFLLVSVNLDNTTGVLPVAHGGTGQTTGVSATNALISSLPDWTADPTDTTKLIRQDTGGYASFGKVTFLTVWNYIKGKIQSIALTIGSTTAAIAETLFGSLSIKNSAGTVTASISQNGTVNGVTVNANGYQLKRYYEIDARSLSSSNFYPVVFAPSDLELDCEVHSPNQSGSAAYNQNYIHFLLLAQGWSDTPKRLDILHYAVFASNEITIGSIGTGNQGGVNCVWVRGGLLYRFYCNRTPSLKTSNYTNGNEVFTVGTNYSGGTNSNLTIQWTPNGVNSAVFGGTLYASLNGNATSADYSRQGAYCTTAAGTAAKVADMRGYALQNGTAFPITFTNANSSASALTLNINGTGAKPIYINGVASSSSNYTLPAGTYICSYTTGAYFIDTGFATTYARNATQANAAYTALSTIAYCSTAAGTAAKTATLTFFELDSEQRILLYIANSNTASTPTLNVNSTGAKAIRINGSTIMSSTVKSLPKGLYMAHYDGTYWNLYNIINLETGTSFNGIASGVSLDTAYGALGVKAWYLSETAGYIVFTNGFKIQYARQTTSTLNCVTKNFPMAFTNIPVCFCASNDGGTNMSYTWTPSAGFVTLSVSKTQYRVNRSSDACTNWMMVAFGV